MFADLYVSSACSGVGRSGEALLWKEEQDLGCNLQAREHACCHGDELQNVRGVEDGRGR